MKTFIRVALGAGSLALVAATLFAQWPSYPTGTPRNTSGQPVLDGPAPKAADGHPDLSGIWTLAGGGRGAGRAGGPPGGGPPPGGPPPNGVPPNGGPPPPPPGGRGGAGAPGGPGRGQVAPDGVPIATFANVGVAIPDGLPLQPWAADLLKARKAENSKDNPDAHCLPLGLMQLHLHPQPRKIIQNAGVTVILYEAQGGVRQIFTDGRKLPPASDVQPWWYGYSVGHWDGDTLVVETTGFRDDVWLDINGSPLTNSGKMTERFRRPNYGTLEITVTIEDPKVYTAPFTVRVNQRIMPDTDLIEFICNENDRSGPHLVGK